MSSAGNSYSVFATPNQIKAAKEAEQELALSASKIKGLFEFLNFSDRLRFERCLGHSGKSPLCLSQAPDGSPRPRGFANLTTTKHNRRMQDADKARQAQIEKARKDNANLTDDEVMEKLEDVFIAYSDNLLYCNTGRYELDSVGWCRLLRDCRLLDNRLTIVQADVIFTRVEAHEDASTIPGEGRDLQDLHIDWDEFMRCLEAVIGFKFPNSAIAKQAREEAKQAAQAAKGDTGRGIYRSRLAGAAHSGKSQQAKAGASAEGPVPQQQQQQQQAGMQQPLGTRQGQRSSAIAIALIPLQRSSDDASRSQAFPSDSRSHSGAGPSARAGVGPGSSAAASSSRASAAGSRASASGSHASISGGNGAADHSTAGGAGRSKVPSGRGSAAGEGTQAEGGQGLRDLLRQNSQPDIRKPSEEEMAQNAAEQAALEAAQAARKAARCTAVIALSRRWLLPFASCGGGSASATDGLFSRATLNSLRRYDLQLKDMFAWYSTLEEYDPTRITWNWSREHATTISSSAFILALYNFGVVPTLLSKVEALEVYVKCEEANDGDERSDAMLLPAFLEAMAQVALNAAAASTHRLQAAASPDELKALKRYVDVCPAPWNVELQAVYQEVLVRRGRDYESLMGRQAATMSADTNTRTSHAITCAGNTHTTKNTIGHRSRSGSPAVHHYQALPLQYDALAAAARFQAQGAALEASRAQCALMGVVVRREEMRQQLALTRLHNFYKDVRTSTNNNTWPPEQHPGTAPSGATRTQMPTTATAADVHVDFFSDSRQIKTPKSQWLPAGGALSPGAGRRSTLTSFIDSPAHAHGHTHATFPTPHLGHEASASGGGASRVGQLAQGGRSTTLMLAGAFGTRHLPAAIRLPPTAAQLQYYNLPSPGPGGRVAMRSAAGNAHYQLRVHIEDLDEETMLRSAAERLPAIHLPGRSLSSVGDGLGSMGVGVSTSSSSGVGGGYRAGYGAAAGASGGADGMLHAAGNAWDGSYMRQGEEEEEGRMHGGVRALYGQVRATTAPANLPGSPAVSEAQAAAAGLRCQQHMGDTQSDHDAYDAHVSGSAGGAVSFQA